MLHDLASLISAAAALMAATSGLVTILLTLRERRSRRLQAVDGDRPAADAELKPADDEIGGPLPPASGRHP
jgi:hypothetical protein